MRSICNGNVTTNANGEATVALPDGFEARTRDFRYQLTVVGQFAQQAGASFNVSGNESAADESHAVQSKR